MLNSFVILNHAISGLRKTGINVSSLASMSRSSALLMSDSLQQNVIDATINGWRKRLRAYVRDADGQHLNTYHEILRRLKKSGTNKV